MILLVDDNADTRKVVAKMLRAYHYTVIEASNGQEALELYKEHENSIDLLLTDVVMPNMTGHELAEVVFQVRPDQKVLYMSAYGPEVLSREYGISTDSFSVLQKPFRPMGLVSKVNEVLGTVVAKTATRHS